jgi:hypothetical protein
MQAIDQQLRIVCQPLVRFGISTLGVKEKRLGVKEKRRRTSFPYFLRG